MIMIIRHLLFLLDGGDGFGSGGGGGGGGGFGGGKSGGGGGGSGKFLAQVYVCMIDMNQNFKRNMTRFDSRYLQTSNISI